MFKEGDRVWWFEYPEQCVGKLQCIAINSDMVIENTRSALSEEYVLLRGGALKHTDVDIFKSREEAFDAIIKYLEKLRDE